MSINARKYKTTNDSGPLNTFKVQQLYTIIGPMHVVHFDMYPYCSSSNFRTIFQNILHKRLFLKYLK